ncbi:MAG: alcohol dehydrogenase catalytic domain-containing protein [Comamonadaceae bacterium]|nr:alcohol dehydrogenase catalytic domain-containing protein [Comamonadaceae bacterium]
MAVGHEYVGEIVEMGSRGAAASRSATVVSGEGHITCGCCRNCLRRAAATCAATPSASGVNRPGRVRRVPGDPRVQCLRSTQRRHRPTTWRSILDPFGNATHTALAFNLRGRGRADHRRRPRC